MVLATGGMLVILGAATGPALAVDKWVTMYANEYRPGVVTINVGDTVTWVNDDDVSHDAVGDGWSTSLLGYYASDSVTFTQAGRYPYHCSIHPQMRSAVVVRGAGGGSGATVPPTDVDAGISDGTDRSQSWASAPVLLLAGVSLLLVLIWQPRRDRPRD
jgi:plastocyanin